jgi:hypothetical protein
MGLYLTVFDGDQEIEGVEVGSYDDFSHFRNAVVAYLEGEAAGSRFPTLIMHSDCDGEWSSTEARLLEKECAAIAEAFSKMPPIEYNSAWQEDVARTFGIVPTSLYDCFFDVDGEPLLERLIVLARVSQKHNLPILFQ